MVGVPHAVALSSGTAALHLAMVLLGVGPGDRVICSSLPSARRPTRSATSGATPVVRRLRRHVDHRPGAARRRAEGLRERPGARAKAVIAVDLYGQCADYDAICAAVRSLRRAADRRRRRGAGRHLQGPRRRRLRPHRRLLVQRQQDHHHVGRRHAGRPTSRRWSTRARFLATQARDPAPHYEHSRDRLQLPDEQRAGRPSAAASCDVLDAAGGGTPPDLRSLRRGPAATCRASTFMPEAPYGRANRWLTCLTIDPRAVRRRPRGGAPRARGREHRGAARLEADAPAAGVRGRADVRRRGVGAVLPGRAVPAERVEPGRGRPGPRDFHRPANVPGVGTIPDNAR